MQKAINFNDVAIVSIKGSDYRIHFWYMSRNDAINITKNSNLNEKSGSLYFFYYIYKWVKQLIKKNRDAILNRAKDYYKNDKDQEKMQKINTEIYLKKKKWKEKIWKEQTP